MKKVAILLVAVAFMIGLLASCNNAVCPAYAKDTRPAQVENNG